jgi:hypothetical protein
VKARDNLQANTGERQHINTENVNKEIKDEEKYTKNKRTT